MGKCITCKGDTKGRIKKCDSCKRILATPIKQYLTPEVELTEKEKKQLDKIREVYDPKFYFDKLFKKIDDSIVN